MALPLSQTNMPDTATIARFMSGVLAVMGVLHFTVPKPFDSIVPEQLPGDARMYTYASGVAELGTAALLAAPSTRRLGGLVALLTFIGVWPANFNMAYQWRDKPLPLRLGAYARLPLQIPMIIAAYRVWKRG